MSFVREPDGKGSASRVVLLLGATVYAVIFVVWFATMVGLFRGAWEWGTFSEAMTWGAAFASTSLVPYLVRRLAGIKENGKDDA